MKSSVSIRSICIGLVLIIPNVYFLINNHVYLSGLPTTISLFYNAVICLFLLVAINLLLRYLGIKWFLSRQELITIYSMLAVGSAMSGHDMIQTVVPALTHGYWYATPENEWQSLFWQHLPGWLVIQDTENLAVYYQGESSVYWVGHYKLWFVPVFWWTAFFAALVAVMISINMFLRISWTVDEKLAFPIVRMPLELTEPKGKFFRSKLMWIGFGVAGGIALWNGVCVLNPFLPQIPTRQFEIGQYFTQRPWNAIGWTPMYMLPFAIGIAFLMPLDLSFSIWFFYWFWKILRVMGNILGMRSLPGFPYDGPQTTGAYIMLALLVLWGSRRHLGQIFKSLFSQRFEYNGEYRTALFIGVTGSIFLFVFAYRMGMYWWVIPMYFGIYYIMGISITRVRAQLGPPTHEMFQATPQKVLVDVLGTRRLGVPTLTSFAMLWGFNRGYRAHPMPHVLEGFWLSEQTKASTIRLALAMLLAAILASATAFWSFIEMSYRNGASVNPPWGGFKHLQNWLFYASPPRTLEVSFMGVGAVVTLTLYLLRKRFLWITLHPAAFALTGSTWTLSWLWFSIFLSWLAKRLIIRHGGIKGYRKALPLFMGLLLGDYVIGGIWIVIRWITGTQTYVFWR
ncbi:hypothetical protein GF312_08025 [Candidatus Poribacteria bacterium]|nr:hypothetical protein [Candidatus Poribacteria bacterium]